MYAFGGSNDNGQNDDTHNTDGGDSRIGNNKNDSRGDKDDGKAFEPVVRHVVANLIIRHRRQITGRVVIDQTRRRGHGDAAKWMRNLGDRQLADFLSRLSCAHHAIVADGHADDNVFIVPATMMRRPMSAKRARREWGVSPRWVARSWALVSTPQQCRHAVADLRQRAFVSVVVDASHRHDLGLVHIAALGDGNCAPRCYTFDTCATPEMEWCGAGDLFDAGGLADLLGDARLPKAVCGFGCGHSRVAHRQSEALMRTPVEIATQTPVGPTGVMVRGAVNVLPLTDGRVSGAVAIALRGRDLDINAWQRAGAAAANDKWQWQRRPLPVALCANAAQRAFTLCVVYEALCDIAGSIDPARALVARRTSDGLLCFAAAQTLAQATWKSVAATCEAAVDDDPRTPESANEWDELERAVRSYIDTGEDIDDVASLSDAQARNDSCGVDGLQTGHIGCVVVIDDGERDRNHRGTSTDCKSGGAREEQTLDGYGGGGGGGDGDGDGDGDDWYGDGRGACADASDSFYEPPDQRPTTWSRTVIEF